MADLLTNDRKRSNLPSYIVGFILSIGFTLWAYFSVVNHTFSGKSLLVWLLALAVAQFAVQLIYFMHIGREAKPRWKQLTIILMIVFVLIVLLGSIWVMYNLNDRMSPLQMQNYMTEQASGGL
ncbi:MAG: cytochrome o ubiquinol oxidase subunit IV [Candidatus Saccharimonadales bacterium]